MKVTAIVAKDSFGHTQTYLYSLIVFTVRIDGKRKKHTYTHVRDVYFWVIYFYAHAKIKHTHLHVDNANKCQLGICCIIVHTHFKYQIRKSWFELVYENDDLPFESLTKFWTSDVPHRGNWVINIIFCIGNWPIELGSRLNELVFDYSPCRYSYKAPKVHVPKVSYSN